MMCWNTCDNVTLRRSRPRLSEISASPRRKKGVKVAEGLQAYINMVTGVTRSTQAKAAATARALLRQAGLEKAATETGDRATKLAEEIMNASRANRELLQHFMMAEVDKAAARLGFARVEEVQALRDEIAGLRAQLDEVIARSAKSAPPTTKKVPAKKAAAAMKPPDKATTRRPGQQPQNTAASSEGASDPEEQ
jgi:polyhydroxyalkanoate synthesis regulator phasin